MKNAFAFALLAIVLVAAGCSNSRKPVSSSITEPLAPAPVAYTPAPQAYTPSPTSAQPVVYDTAPAPAVTIASPSPSGSSYTVKKGDTLFSIAKTRYGNGNQYTKIISANPGLTPESLKAGQTINLP